MDGDVPVTEDEVRAARESIRVLTEDFEQAQFNLVDWNFRAFLEYNRVLPREFQKAIHGAPNPVLRVQTELALRLFNWLHSIRAYLDHTGSRLKRRYGRASDEVAAFEQVTAREFDEVFAYRFFSKLRNYGHIGFPALLVNINERAPIGERLQVRTTVVFDRDTLLTEFSGWGATVKKDLRGRPAHFDVLPLMIEMMESLDTVKEAIGVIEFDVLANAVAVLDALRRRLGSVEGRPTLFRVTAAEGIPRNFEMIDIPPFELPDPGRKSEASNRQS